MPLQKTYSKRGSYYTRPRFPFKKTENRLDVPQPMYRPYRFSLRSIIRQEYINQNPWWMVVHRRGIPRPMVGLDPLEARAVPKTEIRGTLPERIIYKALRDEYHFIPGIDFVFQSSLQGGRIETGGIVADFLFPIMRIVINPLGPTHYETMRMAKDEEQIMALAEMGYTTYMIDESVTYDKAKFDDFMRRVLNWNHFGAQASAQDFLDTENQIGFQADKLKTEVMELSDFIHTGVM